MFAGKGQTEKPATSHASPAPPPTAATGAPAEPAPVNLPVQQLTADVKIQRLFLDQVAITNLQTTAVVKKGEVTLRPFDCTVNGAPVSANAVLNLTVPGYAYDMSMKAEGVPLEPLSNTFTTNAPGQLKGLLFADAQLKGQGTSGPSLQKNLTGNLLLNLTNMNYEIVGKTTKRLLEPIALVLRVPELTQTPLNWIGTKAQIGSGKIDVQQFSVLSQAFFAQSHGTIPMAEVLTNSPLNLPVSLSLRRSLAEKAHLLAPNTPTNAVYAELPTFVTLTGTIGDPKTEINKLVIGGLLAKSIGGIAPVGEKASSILQNLGGALSGQPTSNTNTNSTTRTNAPAAAAIVQELSGLLGAQKNTRSTNSPVSTNKASVSTNKPSVLDLLKLIPEKK
jgi:hypothetical protein